MITRIFYGASIGMAWAIALILMGAAGRAMVELLMIGWNLLS